MLLLFRSIHKEFASQRWEQPRTQAKTAHASAPACDRRRGPAKWPTRCERYGSL
jgi:hypothetical protein